MEGGASGRLSVGVAGTTINCVCGSGMDAVLMASLKISAGDVESMIHVPFLSPKADIAFSRHAEIHDTTIGSRFVNLAINQAYDADPMLQTEQTVADEYSAPPFGRIRSHWPAE